MWETILIKHDNLTFVLRFDILEKPYDKMLSICKEIILKHDFQVDKIDEVFEDFKLLASFELVDEITL
jgi:hypothetical protein